MTLVLLGYMLVRPQGDLNEDFFQDLAYLLPDAYAQAFKQQLKSVLVWEWSSKLHARELDDFVKNPGKDATYMAKYLVRPGATLSSTTRLPCTPRHNCSRCTARVAGYNGVHALARAPAILVLQASEADRSWP